MSKSNAKTQDPDYKGELTGKHLKDGPLNDRKCTDLLCLMVFFGFWVGMGFVGFMAIKTGNPWAVTYAYDPTGTPCGQGNRTDFPLLLFVNDGSDDPYSLTNTVCVKSCTTDQDPVCYSGPDLNGDNKLCVGQGSFPTQEVFNRLCLTTTVAEREKLFSDGLSFGFLNAAASDLMATWPIILAVGGFALVFGFIYLLLMKYFSGVLIWGLLTALILGTAGFGYVAFSTTADGSAISGLSTISPGGLKAIAYSCWGFAAIVLLLLICLREKIGLSIAILKAAAHFIEDEPGILIIPPIFLVLTLGFYIGWVFVVAFIIGMNDLTAKGGNPYASIDWDPKSVGMLAYYFFALLWNHAIGVAVSQFIIASTVCLWYFKQGSKRLQISPVGTSIKRSVNHMGSLAFGSFLIGLLAFIKHGLHFIEKRVNSAVPTGENAAVGFCTACCGCVVGCFERSLKFLTNHAYIQIAMTGESFCTATSEAFFLALRNVVRFSMVHGFAWVFLKLGQFIVAGSATVLGYIIITQATHYQGLVISPIVPTIFFFLSSYIVAHVFMGIYGMSADTIVHCFAMDEEIHDGAVVHAPEELKDYLDNNLTKKFLVGEQ